VQGSADGLPAGTTDVQVGGAAAPVADREDLAGGEQAKASSGIATPMATPTRMSVGASTPRYMRARAINATSPVATHFPSWRQRPSGTRPYKIPTRTTHSAPICAEGSAQAVQAVWNSTPNGRGRCTSGASSNWIITPCRIQASSTTSSCRNRLKINRASSSPHSSTFIAVQEPSAASPRITGSSPGTSNPASHPTTASSTTVTSTARPRSPPAKTSSDSAISTTAAVSHPTPVVWR
jgi:hypothetical protein